MHGESFFAACRDDTAVPAATLDLQASSLAAHAAAQARRDGWHAWTQAAWATAGHGRLFRWLRDSGVRRPEQGSPRHLRRLPPRLTHSASRASRSRAHAILERAWRDLWQGQADAAPLGGWKAAFLHLAPLAAPPPWTAGMAKSAIHSLPLSDAAGLDGWRAEELRGAPEAWFPCLAALVTEVERTGSGPTTRPAQKACCSPRRHGGGARSPPHLALPVGLQSQLHLGQGPSGAYCPVDSASGGLARPGSVGRSFGLALVKEQRADGSGWHLAGAWATDSVDPSMLPSAASLGLAWEQTHSP